MYLTLREEQLLDLLFSQKITKEQIESVTNKLDIDTENRSFLLALSILGYKCNWNFFPVSMIPRLKGLHQYFQVNNIFKFDWLVEKIRILRNAGIPVMLLKGLALRYYYAPGHPRMMGDFDIAVPEEKFETVMNVLNDGKDKHSISYVCYHNILENGGKVIEVHKWIFKNNGEKGTDIWERAIEIDFYGTKVFVPCPQDMFIHQLDNRSRDIFVGTFLKRRINWLFDCRCIWNFMNETDRKTLRARVKDFKVEYSVRHMLILFSKYFPQVFDEKKVEEMFPNSKEYETWFTTGIQLQKYCRDYENKYNMRRTMTISRAFDFIMLNIKHYKFWCLDRNIGLFGFSFFRYMKECLGIYNIGDLWRKYIKKFFVSKKLAEYNGNV